MTLVSLYRWIVGLLYVGAICGIVITCSLFLPPAAYDPFFKAAMRFLFRLLFIPVRIAGSEKLRPGRPVLYMANHVSIFDSPLLGGFLPGRVRGVEWAPHFRWPLLGVLLSRIGNIPIDRDDVFSSMKSMDEARRRFQRGESLAIMPEAHRTTDGNLRHFKRLPFHMARAAGVDIVPVGTSGLYSLNNKNSWRIRSSRIRIAIGEPIAAEDAAAHTVDELRRIMHQRIQGLITRP
jgi:1-acyl-sn-glycerol-3-phosphate acyltransferase